jgi:hypothetical protein
VKIPPRPLVIAWAVASLGAVTWSLAGLSIERPPDPAAAGVAAEAGAANLRALAPFWLASLSGWAALTALWLIRPRAEACGRFVPTALAVLGVALAARVVVLVTHVPSLSDDLHRYVLDGGNGARGTNPYLERPADVLARAERWPGEHAAAAAVNNPEMHTIYLPTSQGVFALADRLARVSTSGAETDVVAAGRVFRAVFVGLEMLAMGLVLVALAIRRRAAWWIALYAWHPLPLAEIAGSGHQDAIGLAGLAAVLALTAGPRRSAGRAALWTLPLAVTALVKPFVVPVAAFLLRRRPAREWAASLAVGAVVCTVAAVPLLSADGWSALENLRETSARFSLKWAHFGSVYEPLLAVIEAATPAWGNDPQEQLARAICLALLAAVLVVVWVRGRDAWASVAGVLLAMVLLAPAVHPWYLLWALVLVPVAPSRAIWTASLTLSWGYAALGDPAEWTTPVVVMAAAYVPVYAALALDLYHARRAAVEEGAPS